jgi:hypothetical protein
MSWLVTQATAVLASVAATNYVCYGRAGVPYYSRQREQATTPDTTSIDVALRLLDANQQSRLAWAGMRLTMARTTVNDTLWSTYDASRRLQTLWIWDFYRIQSHIALRVKLPTEGETPDDPWRTTLEALRAALPGDMIEIDVFSACGDLHQKHTLAAAAAEWKPTK